MGTKGRDLRILEHLGQRENSQKALSPVYPRSEEKSCFQSSVLGKVLGKGRLERKR